MGCESSTQGYINTQQQPTRNQQFSSLNSGQVLRANGNPHFVPTPAVYLTGRERLGNRQPVLIVSATSLHTASQKQNQLRQRQSQEQFVRAAKHQEKIKEEDMSQQKETTGSDEPVTVEMLQNYIEVEKKIRELESKNTTKNFDQKSSRLEDLKETVKSLEDHYKQCCKQTAKEKADVDNMQGANVRNFFKDQETFDKELTREQEEYLEALSAQEVSKKQLDGVAKQKEELQKEVAEAKRMVETLEESYTKQETLLSNIFRGKYGSELENQLEAELELLLEKKQRVGVAKYKWVNGRVLLTHACNQLAFAVRRWQDIGKVAASNMELRYLVATEVRNNLIAAAQNITNAQRYLSNIEFPYCKPNEIDTLQKAFTNIYIDMRSHDRHQHAWNCYMVTHKRTAALLQWFDYVLKNVVERDLKQASQEEKKKENALRSERLKLIRQRIEEAGGSVKIDDDLDNDGDGDDDDVEPELTELAQPDDVAGATELPGGGEKDPGSKEKAPAPTPVPLSELAAPPSEEELFGNIEMLKKQHDKEMKDFKRSQEMNKARLQQGLDEKLAARRGRRDRMTAK
ncbi:hypothetical protein ScPMuIL_002858 [Solemya velum]